DTAFFAAWSAAASLFPAAPATQPLGTAGGCAAWASGFVGASDRVVGAAGAALPELLMFMGLAATETPLSLAASSPTDTLMAAPPVAQREVVVLHKVEGLSFEQVAEAIGITSTAARIRAHRGYVKLRELLKHLEEA